jgi:hypothetical protein
MGLKPLMWVVLINPVFKDGVTKTTLTHWALAHLGSLTEKHINF